MPRSQLSPEEIYFELDRICASEGFLGAERLQILLKHIVSETVAGRKENLLGKNISHDIFGTDPKQNEDISTVRVEVGRLRRRLHRYYEKEGADGAVKIDVPKGAYAASFSILEASDPSNSTGDIIESSNANRRAKTNSLIPLALTFSLGAAAAVIAIELIGKNGSTSHPKLPVVLGVDPQEQAVRQVLLEQSPVTLQAATLANQAREMIFPIFDVPRQKLVYSVFRQVIALDPEYSGGYAGAAQTLATFAIISPPGKVKQDALAEADLLIQKALRIDPTDAWTQSANAWLQVATGDYDRAFELSSRATELDPNDGHVLDFHGAISLFSGRFEDAIVAANRDHLQGLSNQRFANRNIYGAANYHLGNFSDTLRAFDAAAQFGDPISAPSLAYQAAALQNLGRINEAKEKLNQMNEAWPNARLDVMFYGIYQNRELADQILLPLTNLGWKHGSSR